MSDSVDWAVEHGYLEECVDELGKVRYRVTNKMYEERPDVAREWEGLVSKTIFSLWDKGFIEIDFLEGGTVIYPLPDPAKFEEIDTLSPIERDVLIHIQANSKEVDDGWH